MKSLYAQTLGYSFQPVIQQSIDHRNMLQEYVTCIKHRIVAEESYAKQLTHIQDSLQKLCQKPEIAKSSISFLFAALKSDALRRSIQIKNFAESLKEEILIPTKALVQSQATQSKKLEKEARGYQKQDKELQERLQYLREKLGMLGKQLEEETVKNEIMKVRCGFNIEEKQKQQLRISELKQQQQLSETLYKTTVQENNTFKQSSREDVNSLHLKFEENVILRIEKMIDNIKKLMIFETAMMRNFDYDVVNIHNQIEVVNPKKDIEIFAEDHRKFPKPEVKQNKLYITAVIDQMESKEFERKIAFESGAKMKEFIEQTVKGREVKELEGYNEIGVGEFRGILAMVDAGWNGEGMMDKTGLERFRGQMENDENRYLFQLGFRSYNAFFNKESNKSLSVLIQIAIQKSIQRKDIFTIRKILYAIFTKWSTNQHSKPKQLPLYRSLQSNPLWKNLDFWDAAIFQSIQEKLRGIIVQKGETREETKMKQQNIILSQLASYCHIMIMMGNSQKSVKMSVGKYCRLHGLGEEENKVLSKSIAETLVTYKEYN